jgi:hypothetical protein
MIGGRASSRVRRNGFTGPAFTTRTKRVVAGEEKRLDDDVIMM